MLKKKDYCILYELSKNSEQPYTSIAKKLNLSKDAIIYHIKRLTEKGIIKQFTTIIDASKLGYFNVRVYLKLKNITVEKRDKLFERLTKNKLTWYVSAMEGNWNVDFMMWVKGTLEFETFWHELLLDYGKYVEDRLIGVVTRVHVSSPAFLNDKKINDSTPIIFGSDEKVKVDELDFGILRMLSKDSRISLLDLSKALNASAKSIGYRIKRLKDKKIILGSTILLDNKKLNFGYYKVNVYLSDISKRKSLMQFAYQNPHLCYVDEVLGGWDFEFEVTVRDHNEFRTIIEEMEQKFGDVIKSYSYFIFHHVYKTEYMPHE